MSSMFPASFRVAKCLLNYSLLLVFLLPHPGKAQSKVTGLGNYLIGLTTPDSLNPVNFKEGDQSYVKGTLALPCTHIRTFTADTVTIAGVSAANVVLVFYDDRLFRISSDYTDTLKKVFLAQYGQGISKSVSRFQFCTAEKDKPLLLWGETWPGVNIQALVVYSKGYTADCRLEEGAKLLIFSQKISDLSSECDLKHTTLFVEEFIQAQRGK